MRSSATSSPSGCWGFRRGAGEAPSRAGVPGTATGPVASVRSRRTPGRPGRRGRPRHGPLRRDQIRNEGDNAAGTMRPGRLGGAMRQDPTQPGRTTGPNATGSARRGPTQPDPTQPDPTRPAPTQPVATGPDPKRQRQRGWRWPRHSRTRRGPEQLDGTRRDPGDGGRGDATGPDATGASNGSNATGSARQGPAQPDPDTAGSDVGRGGGLRDAAKATGTVAGDRPSG